MRDNFAFWAIVLLGVIFTGLGLFLLIQTAWDLRGSRRAIGTVVDNKETEEYWGASDPGIWVKVYHPIIEFKLPSGETSAFESKFGQTDKPLYPTGTAIKIRYQASNPARAYQDSFWATYAAPVGSLIFGLALVFLVWRYWR